MTEDRYVNTADRLKAESSKPVGPIGGGGATESAPVHRRPDLRAMALDFALRRTGHDDSDDRVIEYAQKFYNFLTARD